MKTCKNCRHLVVLKLGDNQGEFCVGAPPSAMVTVNQEAKTITVNAVYPTMPPHPCGMWESRRWWARWMRG